MYVKDIIEDIDYLNLDEKNTETLINAVNIIKNRRRKSFIRSLKTASKIVDSWPSWKRIGLGKLNDKRN